MALFSKPPAKKPDPAKAEPRSTGPRPVSAREVAAQAAVPPRFHTEAILHARMYSPEEALERSIVHGVVRPAERVAEEARAAAAPLAALDQAAYAISKARHRAMVVKWATELLETEVGALPSRATIK